MIGFFLFVCFVLIIMTEVILLTYYYFFLVGVSQFFMYNANAKVLRLI